MVIGSLKEEYIDNFKHDPLYNLVTMNCEEEEIFTEGILSINVDATYNTIKASKFIGRADATIRAYLRSELSNVYIMPEKDGNYYRLDYITIFRIHIISLLIEKAGMTTAQILIELGERPTRMADERKELSPIQEDMRKFKIDLENQKRSMNELLTKQNLFLETQHKALTEQQMYMLFILESERLINKYKFEIANHNTVITQAKSSIKELESKAFEDYLLEKQSIMMANSMRRKQKNPFLALFSKKEEESQLILDDIDTKLRKKRTDSIQNEVKALEEKINKNEFDREAIEKKLNDEVKNLETLNGKAKILFTGVNSLQNLNVETTTRQTDDNLIEYNK